MSNTPHELAAEFPEYVDRMHQLKEQNARFAKLFDEYHALNRQIHRAETNVEPVAELAEVAMRKERVAMKDEIYQIITSAEA